MGLIDVVKDAWHDHREGLAVARAAGGFASGLVVGATLAREGMDVFYGIDVEESLGSLASAAAFVKGTTGALYGYVSVKFPEAITGAFSTPGKATLGVFAIDMLYKYAEWLAMDVAGAEHADVAMIPALVAGLCKSVVIAELFHRGGRIPALVHEYQRRNRYLTLDLTPQLAEEYVYNDDKFIA